MAVRHVGSPIRFVCIVFTVFAVQPFCNPPWSSSMSLGILGYTVPLVGR